MTVKFQNGNKSKAIIAGIIILPVLLAIFVGAHFSGKTFPVRIFPGLIGLYLIFQVFYQFRVVRVGFIILAFLYELFLVITKVSDYFRMDLQLSLLLYGALSAVFWVMLAWFLTSNYISVEEEEPSEK